jgi:hypothetical protein
MPRRLPGPRAGGHEGFWRGDVTELVDHDS